MSSAWHAEGLHCAEAVGLSLRSYEAQERLRSDAAQRQRNATVSTAMWRWILAMTAVAEDLPKITHSKLGSTQCPGHCGCGVCDAKEAQLPFGRQDASDM